MPSTTECRSCSRFRTPHCRPQSSVCDLPCATVENGSLSEVDPAAARSLLRQIHVPQQDLEAGVGANAPEGKIGLEVGEKGFRVTNAGAVEPNKCLINVSSISKEFCNSKWGCDRVALFNCCEFSSGFGFASQCRKDPCPRKTLLRLARLFLDLGEGLTLSPKLR